MSNFVAEFMIVYETMTLRELLQSVDAEAYTGIHDDTQDTYRTGN